MQLSEFHLMYSSFQACRLESLFTDAINLFKKIIFTYWKLFRESRERTNCFARKVVVSRVSLKNWLFRESRERTGDVRTLPDLPVDGQVTTEMRANNLFLTKSSRLLQPSIGIQLALLSWRRKPPMGAKEFNTKP